MDVHENAVIAYAKLVGFFGDSGTDFPQQPRHLTRDAITVSSGFNPGAGRVELSSRPRLSFRANGAGVQHTATSF